MSLQTGRLADSGDNLNEPALHFMGLRHTYMLRTRDAVKSTYEQDFKKLMLKEDLSLDELNCLFSTVYDYLIDYTRNGHVNENTPDIGSRNKSRLVYVARKMIGYVFEENMLSKLFKMAKDITGLDFVYAEHTADEGEDVPVNLSIVSDPSVDVAKARRFHLEVTSIPIMVNVRNLILHSINAMDGWSNEEVITHDCIISRFKGMDLAGVIDVSTTSSFHRMMYVHPRDFDGQSQSSADAICAYPDLRYSACNLCDLEFVNCSVPVITCDSNVLQSWNLAYELPILPFSSEPFARGVARYPTFERSKVRIEMVSYSDVVMISSLIKLMSLLVISQSSGFWVGSFFPVVAGLNKHSYRMLTPFSKYCAQIMWCIVRRRRAPIARLPGTDTRQSAVYKHLLRSFASSPDDSEAVSAITSSDDPVTWDVPRLFQSYVPKNVRVMFEHDLTPSEYPKII